MKISLLFMGAPLKLERNLYETVCRHMRTNKLLESPCIKLSIEHTTTFDSRINLIYIKFLNFFNFENS